MNETKQLAPKHQDSVSKTAFWGTILLGVVALLAFGYYIVFFLRLEKTPVVYIALAIYAFTFIVTMAGIILAFRGRQKQSAELALYTLLLFGVSATSVLSGRIQSSTFSILLVSVIAILYLLPRQPRRRYVSITATAFAAMWVIEWINPPWRIEFTAAKVGPVAVVIFALVFVWVIFSQSRRFVEASLRNKLVAGSMVLTVISIGTLAAFNYFNNRANLIDAAGTAVKSVANSQAAGISGFLSQEAETMQSFNLNKLVQVGVVEANNSYGPDQAANLEQIESLDRQWRAADAADNNNNSLVRARLNNDIASELREFRDAFPENAEVFVTDKYGALIAATNRTSDYYQADEGWWQAAYNNGQGAVYFGEPEYDESSKTFGIIMAMPILAHDTNKVAGIMRTTLNIESVLAILNTEILDGSGKADLYLPNGEVLDPEFIAGLNQGDPEVLAQLGVLLDNAEYASITYEGHAGVVSAAPVASADPKTQSAIQNLGWTLIVHQDESAVLAPVQKQTQATVLVALAIMGLSALASLLLSQTLTGSLGRLTATAEQIAAGDLTAQAKVESSDEIGAMASAFNTMTAKLRESLATLEQRVADRTRNLELAAEVGRSVSQVRALDVMLKDACDLILKEFDLYYVQVYLTDASGSNLKLETGTGSVGDQLVARGHSLPLTAASINGRAAVEKRSVVISDTATNATFQPNSLLPETRSEMAVPLIVADKVVGALDMQSSQPGALTTDVLPAFEALAGQLAVAIQNANLFAEAEQARAEVEKQARRLVQQGWNEYLDAIHKPEQIGYIFDRNQIAPISDAEDVHSVEYAKAVSAPISVTGEPLGSLTVEVQDESQREQTSALINTVARQVAQQIENLRLLESAERYRYEAEQASRRLTREGWKSYAEKDKESLQYLYDLNEVRPVSNDKNVKTSATIPLKVRDEVVGKLAVQGLDKNDAEALNLVNAVAERLSAHVESLRQYDATQSALAQSERLFESSRILTQSQDLQELTASSVKILDIPAINRAVLASFGYDSEDNIDSLDIIASWWDGTGHVVTPIGTHYSLDVIRVMPMFVSPTPVFFNDTFNDARVDAVTLQLAQRQNLRAVAVLPLFSGMRQIGALILEAEQPHNFSQEEARLFTALAPQIATVLENRRQFERAQGQAKREATLNLINQKIQSATSVEAVLQIAARELGTALGAPMTVAQLSLKDASS